MFCSVIYGIWERNWWSDIGR